MISAEHADPEQDKQPADRASAGRSHEAGVALAETVAIPQLNESNSDSNVSGFSRSVMSTAAIATVTRMPSAARGRTGGRAGRRPGGGATPRGG